MAKKPRAARALRVAPRATSTASTNGEPRDDSHESDETATDEALAEFLAAPPANADHVQVIAVMPSGDAVVQLRQRAEVLRDPDAIANAVTKACDRWALAERRIVRFRANWARGDRTLATHAFEHGAPSDQPPELNGSVQSFLSQQQLFAQAQHKLHLEGFEMVQESWKSLLTLQNKRIEALERDNAELRDRLRKVDDVGNELAIESARAEIEQRGRTADLIEKRLLPIAQAVVAQKLQESAAALSGHGKPEHSEQKQPAANT
jgi:hypothetical protein